MFDFVFDRLLPINDPMVFNLRLDASLSTKVRKRIFSLMDLNKMFFLQVMFTIVLGRLARFHSDTNVDASCFNEHKVWLKHENYVFDVMHFLQVT